MLNATVADARAKVSPASYKTLCTPYLVFVGVLFFALKIETIVDYLKEIVFAPIGLIASCLEYNNTQVD